MAAGEGEFNMETLKPRRSQITRWHELQCRTHPQEPESLIDHAVVENFYHKARTQASWVVTEIRHWWPADLRRPQKGDIWHHADTGGLYTIMMLTNTEGTNPMYDIQVVYQGLDKRIWSKPLSAWYEAMTFVSEEIS